MKARRAALQLLRNTIVSAPERLGEFVSGLSPEQYSSAPARPGGRTRKPNPEAVHESTTATRIALRSLAMRILRLEEEIADLERS
jgi:hypothetical protein